MAFVEEAAAALPLDEAAQARLIRVYQAIGRRADALSVFARVRRQLADELGVDPGAELRQLYESILREEPPAVVRAQPGTVEAPVRPAQLPADVAAFTGRAGYLDQLDRLLVDTSAATSVVVMVVEGGAGVGKTALAVHWAHRVRDRFPDGQLYVNLRGYDASPPVRPIEALAQMLHALGVPAAQLPLEVEQAAGLYRSLLADKRILVVLDNARHPDQVRPAVTQYPRLPGPGH
jgi:Bacterial transcriptional activator domain